MRRRVEILQRRNVFHRAIFRIDEVLLQHERFDGSMGPPITRLVLERGESVAVLPHDPVNRVVLLCEQFRLPAAGNGPGWLLEIPAGILEPGEDLEACARRELIEETGYSAGTLEPIATVYLSPGGSSERIHIFHGEIATRADAADTAGVQSEGEDIRIVPMAVDDAIAKVRAGEILDAKTVIALQWLDLAIRAKS
ncbi:MAG TPA: NUDIX hydrolase [Vicinamibacterales bacterium]|nr:NUDIX hydrolase [Vicinamibacterales bacterium]